MCLTLKKRLKKIEGVEGWNLKLDLDEKLRKDHSPDQIYILHQV